MKILMIDDSRLSQKMLRTVLGEEHELIEASNGTEGIEKYRLFKPDLVFLDLIMPGMNGLDVLKELRQMDPQAKVILGTADLQPVTWEEGRRLGALRIIHKPFQPHEVRKAIRDLFSS